MGTSDHFGVCGGQYLRTRLTTAARDAGLFGGRREEAYELAVALESRTVPEMRARARAFGWRVRGQRRDDIVAQMIGHYMSPDSAALAVDCLSDFERRVLSVVAWVELSDRERFAEVGGKLLSQMQDGWSGAPLGQPSEATVDLVVGDLQDQGYIINLHQVYVDSLGFVPRTFSERLLPVVDLTPAPESVDAGAVRPARDPVQDLVAAWRVFGSTGSLPWVDPLCGHSLDTPTGWPGTKPLQTGSADAATTTVPIPAAGLPIENGVAIALVDALGEDGNDFAAFVTILALAGHGLVFDSDETRLTASPQGLLRSLAVGPDGLVDMLVQAWYRMPYGRWDELSWLQASGTDWIVAREGGWWRLRRETYNSELHLVRRLLSEMLMRWPTEDVGGDGGWVDVAAFSNSLQVASVDEVLPGPSTSAWFAIDLGSVGALDPADVNDWMRGAHLVLQYVLDGPLRWLGLVDTATGSDGSIAAARLSQIGRQLVLGVQVHASSDSPPSWLDDQTVEVEPCIANLGFLEFLIPRTICSVADRGPLRFRFAAEALDNTFAAGMFPGDVVDGLVELGLRVPTELEKQIRLWWLSWGRVRRYSGLSIIEVSDAGLARELLATVDLAELVVAEICPTVFVVEAGSVQQVVKALEAAGHTPTLVAAASGTGTGDGGGIEGGYGGNDEDEDEGPASW